MGYENVNTQEDVNICLDKIEKRLKYLRQKVNIEFTRMEREEITRYRRTHKTPFFYTHENEGEQKIREKYAAHPLQKELNAVNKWLYRKSNSCNSCGPWM